MTTRCDCGTMTARECERARRLDVGRKDDGTNCACACHQEEKDCCPSCGRSVEEHQQYFADCRFSNHRRAFSSSVFIYFDKKVLLIRHKLLDLWLPVGGEREGNETPLETARREALEETGLEVKFPRIPLAPAGTPPGFLGYEEHAAGPKGYHMNFCFLAYAFSNVLKSDGSWDKHRWVNPFDLQGDKNTGIPENVLDMVWQVRLMPLALPEELE